MSDKPDIENMSDDDFLNVPAPTSLGLEPEEEVEPVVQEEPKAELEQEAQSEDEGTEGSTEGDDITTGEDDSGESADEPESKPTEQKNPLADDDDAPEQKPEPKAATDKKKVEKPAEGKQDEKAKSAEPVKAEDKSEPVNYEQLYKEIMKPFKANGKEITLNNPAEAVQLMQMGANYTKKMQALQPVLRVAKMLENNGLMDEGKLGFLIDLNKRDPEAIKKLLKDSGIDPMDIDTSQETQYKAKNYAPSDKQMAFDSALDDVSSTDVGKKTVVMINKEWDKASKEALYQDPEILRVITNQVDQGLYDQISEEVNRQRMLGYLTNVPFITAYKQVGDIMAQNGFLRHKEAAPAPAQQQAQVAPVQQQAPVKQVLETRTAPRKTVSDNGDKARAASPVRTAPQSGKPDYNPLAMSDEDFENTASLAKRL